MASVLSSGTTAVCSVSGCGFRGLSGWRTNGNVYVPGQRGAANPRRVQFCEDIRAIGLIQLGAGGIRA
eukprot:7758518-Pyramimonas_sp.AAC.1